MTKIETALAEKRSRLEVVEHILSIETDPREISRYRSERYRLTQRIGQLQLRMRTS